MKFKKHYKNRKIQEVLNLKEDCDGLYTCPHCSKRFKCNAISIHIWRKHTEEGKNHSNKLGEIIKNNPNHFIPTGWNKGLTKETDERVKNISKSLTGRIKVPLTEEHKAKISRAMKYLHAEGKHPGWSFINNDISRRSYPEKFFLKVLQNNHIFEKFEVKEKMPFGKYTLDFAIPCLKLDVEIDGQQHFRNTDSIEHDKQRDLFLQSSGWVIYRIKWSDLFHNTKLEIKRFLEFLN